MECGETGDCVNCNTCQIAGVCLGGADHGSACFSNDDCDGALLCLCGSPVDCTFTTVIARSPAAAPTLSTGGWVGTIAALMGIAALALRRRLRGH